MERVSQAGALVKDRRRDVSQGCGRVSWAAERSPDTRGQPRLGHGGENRLSVTSKRFEDIRHRPFECHSQRNETANRGTRDKVETATDGNTRGFLELRE